MRWRRGWGWTVGPGDRLPDRELDPPEHDEDDESTRRRRASERGQAEGEAWHERD
jgi:hypothetical protein